MLYYHIFALLEIEIHVDGKFNRPRSIYQYSNMTPRLSGQTYIFGVVFFVSKSLLGIERQKKHEEFANLTRKPRTHARILIYRTWPIAIVMLLWCPGRYLWRKCEPWDLAHTHTSFSPVPHDT